MRTSLIRRVLEATLLVLATLATLATGVAPPEEGGASYSDWIDVAVPPVSSVSFRAVADWGVALALDVEPHGLVVIEGPSLPVVEGLELLSATDLEPGTSVPGVGTVLAPDAGNGLYEVDLDSSDEVDRHVGDDPLAVPRFKGYFTLWNGSDEPVAVQVRAAAMAGPKPDSPSLAVVDVP